MIIEEIKRQFKQTDNTVIKLIWINLLVFVGIRLVAVFLELFLLNEGIKAKDILTPYIFLSDDLNEVLLHPWTLITTMFTQWDLMHLLSNLLGLYLIGRFFQSEFGSKRLLGVYLLTGFGAHIFYLIVQQTIPFYLFHQNALVGASGSITGLIIALTTFFPEREIGLFLIPVRFKLKWLALVMVTLFIISLTGGNGGGEVCHLGGALMGFLYAKLYQKGTDLTKPIIKTLTFIETLFTPKPKMKVSHSNFKSKKSNIQDVEYSEVTSDKIDVILEKLKVSGYASLSKKEKDILFEFSKK